MSGIMADDSFMALYKTPQQAIVEVTRFFFYGMMKTEEPK